MFQGLRLFKGLCLLFLSNVPGAMFIQGGTFISDSRVLTPCSKSMGHHDVEKCLDIPELCSSHV